MDLNDKEAFQKAAEEFARGVEVPVMDPTEKRRGELQDALLRAVNEAAQAKADLIAESQGGDNMRPAANFRNAERDALNALSTLIEWEATQR